MAETLMSDLSSIIPSVIQPMAQTKLAQYIDFMMHGVMDRVSLPAGNYVTFPSFKELSGTADRMVDSGSYDINKIDAIADIAAVCHRIKVFGANDLSSIVSGTDPMGAISSQIARYFAKVVQLSALSVLKGQIVTSGALNATNLYDVFVDDATEGNQKPMTSAIAAKGLGKLGDELNNIAAWVMHGKVVADLLAAGYVSTYTQRNQAIDIGNMGEVLSFMGRPIIMADSCTTIAGSSATKYITYGLAKGALAYGIQKDLNPEIGRDSKDKVSYISTDLHYAAHLRGCAYQSGTGGANPIDTTLATATSWALVAESAKNVGMVAIGTN